MAWGASVKRILPHSYSACSSRPCRNLERPSSYRSSPTRPLPIQARMPVSRAALQDCPRNMCMSIKVVVPVRIISMQARRDPQ